VLVAIFGAVRLRLRLRVSAVVGVPMVQVWRVIVTVLEWVVAMRMRVFAEHGRDVAVLVVAVVVSVGMFVFERFVTMAVLVPFGQMQVGAEGEARDGERAAPAECAIAKEPCHERAHERGECEDGSRSRGANSGLRLEVQA